MHLPITRFPQVQRFAARCGASVPAVLARRFEGLDGDPETHRLIAAAVAIEEVETLQRHGVREFHFYTLNRADLCYAICHLLGLRPLQAAPVQPVVHAPVAPVVAVSWAIGRWFVETPPIELPQFTMTAIASAEFWRQIASQWPQLLPFAIGASIVSVVCALVSYPLMLYVLRAYRRKYPNNSAATSATLNRESFTERN